MSENLAPWREKIFIKLFSLRSGRLAVRSMSQIGLPIQESLKLQMAFILTRLARDITFFHLTSVLFAEISTQPGDYPQQLCLYPAFEDRLH